MAEAQILSDAYIAIKDGKILAVGTGQPEPELIDDHTEVKSCEGKVATPGLIDCHTHLVYGGSREHEFAKKISGCFLLRHPRPRRWILSTVRATRKLLLTIL